MASVSRQCFDASPYLSLKHTTYFQVYDDIFSGYRERAITFVEIGVLNGGSLFMWRQFFGDRARIIGIDLNPIAKRWERDGFEIYVGSQSDPSFWTDFFAQVGSVDIVLDDGGHTYEQQIVTTECCIPHIRNGGLLVVEDTHTSYMRQFGGPSRFSFVGYATNKVDGVNGRFGYFAKKRANFEKEIYCVKFFESFVVFEVDRTKCLVSQEACNNGKTVDAVDFRYADARSIEVVTSWRDRFASSHFSHVLPRVLKSFDRLVVHPATKMTNRWRTFRLHRFFRY